jgi:ABC-type phosphate/phosphonate transport system substrate-binding protein
MEGSGVSGRRYRGGREVDVSTACMPWYYLPEIEAAQDHFWQGLARHLRRQGVSHLPRRLTRGVAVQSLHVDPTLIFGQSCGYDLIYGFSATLGYIATPVYSAPGCDDENYSSFILVRDDEKAADVSALRGRTAVINGFNSHSGANALRSVVAPFSRAGRFFAGVKVSGSHVASLEMLLTKKADIMAIDCVLHALLVRHRPAALRGTRIIGQSAPVPAPPFVMSAALSGELRQQIRTGLAETLADSTLDGAMSEMLLLGASVLSEHAYLKIVEQEAVALAKGYFELHATTPALRRTNARLAKPDAALAR